MDSLLSIFLCQMVLLWGDRKIICFIFFKFNAILMNFHPSLEMFCRGVLYLGEVGLTYLPYFTSLPK